jgi:hypothetical protein
VTWRKILKLTAITDLTKMQSLVSKTKNSAEDIHNLPNMHSFHALWTNNKHIIKSSCHKWLLNYYVMNSSGYAEIRQISITGGFSSLTDKNTTVKDFQQT